MAHRTAARVAALADEADSDEDEYYIRMRDAWITLANGCEFLDTPDVTAGLGVQAAGKDAGR